jgi:chromosome segregation ATPase
MLQLPLAVDWPMIVFPALIGGGAITAGWMWIKHKIRRGKVEAELDEFKTRVVRSGDVMDGLREKHKKLPAVDEDFTVPMEGATRQEYDAIEIVLDNYRDRWLELMETWDKVQELVETEGTGRKAQFQQASAMLKDQSKLEQLAALESECKQRIGRLENAHEDARAAIGKVEGLSEELIGELGQIAAREYAPDPYQTEMDVVAELTDTGTQQVDADPLTASSTLSDAREQLEALLQRTRDVIQCEDAARGLDKKVEDLDTRTKKMRADGFLFAEPEASPDKLAADFGSLRSEIKLHLNRGGVDTARRALDAMQRRVDELETVLDTSVTMQDNCRTLLEERRSAMRRLLDEAATAQLEEKHLEKNYPVDSWRGAIDNLESARGMVATMSELLDQAEAAIDIKTQHYIRASHLIAEVRSREAEVSDSIAEVTKRRQELDAQRAECEARVDKIESESDRIGRLLTESRADRDLCNNRYRMARDRVQDVLRSTRQEPTDWPYVATKVEECGADFQRVEELFKQDLQLHGQAQSEVAQAEQEIRKARSFYRAGISADLSRASGILLDASRALSNQDYERAVQHANQAQQAARDALGAAQQRMERRQRELDRVQWQRRQRQMRDLVQFGAAAAARAIQEMGRR